MGLFLHLYNIFPRIIIHIIINNVIFALSIAYKTDKTTRKPNIFINLKHNQHEKSQTSTDCHAFDDGMDGRNGTGHKRC